MIVLDTHIVPPNISNIRLSDYAIHIFSSIPTRKGIKKAIKKGAVRIDGQVADTGRWVQSEQVIQLIEIENIPSKPFPLSLEIVYEDNTIAVINKPAGIVVSGNQYRTIENALSTNLTLSTAVDAYKNAKPVHRLDHATSGLLLIAKTRKARVDLGKQFENKDIRKQYQAIVIGQPLPKGTIDLPIEDKPAWTNYKVLQSVNSLKNKQLSLLELIPITGRTHQLRIHLAQLGHPILGDKLYGTEGKILKKKGLFLCSVGLSFRHPITQDRLNLIIKTPNKFQLLMEREARRWEKNSYKL